eukprot:TRINITY_DN3800_c0_g1_i5.p1 TRINITY_DN3800_c0_g1~~TRINITY_DN3800_c0_g1_i5.p1  ORF type:complete len:236 (+),score=93.16 TRINITY_DN3800_c0_g1_i5:150-857(+)
MLRSLVGSEMCIRDSTMSKSYAMIAGGIVALISSLYVSHKVIQSRKKVTAIVVSGPPGVGRGNIISRLIREHRDTLALCVSHTTRAPRAGEIEGEHFHFVDEKTMLSMIGDDKFVETTQIHGHMYGTSKASLAAITSSGKTAIIEVDVNGANALKKEHPEIKMHFVFIQAPSMKDLEARIRAHDGNGDKVEKRVATALAHVNFVKEHPSLYNTIVTNDDPDRVYKRMVALLKNIC